MWLLPFLTDRLPGMKFVHVVRDGRDMALSANHYLLARHGDRLLGSAWRQDAVSSQLKIWRIGNQKAWRDASSLLPSQNYLVLRYEDLCADPASTLETLYRFAGILPTNCLIDRGLALVRPSARIGMWRTTEDCRLISPPPDVAEALAQFGY